MFLTVSKKLSNIKNSVIKKLPDKTIIFISALWFWVYIAYICNHIFGRLLGYVLHITPDDCIIFHPKLLKENKDAPKVIEARLGTEPITNKINMLINKKWDVDISDSGGINIRELLTYYPKLSTSVIWISYLFDLDKKLETLDEEEIGKKIRHMLINITDKKIFRESSLDESEEIIFGEIPF